MCRLLCDFYKNTRHRNSYRSKIDPTALLEKAKAELQYEHPEAYKAFVLCLLLGLRRKEADLLLWDSIDLKQQVVHIERTQYFDPKTEHSQGDIPILPGMIETLNGLHEARKGIFVLNSKVPPRPMSTYGHYRAQRHFKKLTIWLRAQGVENTCPIHTLRKEFGRLITEQHGIYAASRMLRHGSIQITAAHYADDTRRLSTGLETAL